MTPAWPTFVEGVLRGRPLGAPLLEAVEYSRAAEVVLGPESSAASAGRRGRHRPTASSRQGSHGIVTDREVTFGPSDVMANHLH